MKRHASGHDASCNFNQNANLGVQKLHFSVRFYKYPYFHHSQSQVRPPRHCDAAKGPPTCKARSPRNTKSGLPNIRTPRRQPLIPCFRDSAIIPNSVSRLPRLRMRDMTSLRFLAEKMSAIRTSAVQRVEAVKPGSAKTRKR
jgi:hypothetical protein